MKRRETRRVDCWVGSTSGVEACMWGTQICDRMGNRVKLRSTDGDLLILRDRVLFKQVGKEDLILVGVGGMMSEDEKVVTAQVVETLVRARGVERVALVGDDRPGSRLGVEAVQRRLGDKSRIPVINASVAGLVEGEFEKGIKQLIVRK